MSREGQRIGVAHGVVQALGPFQKAVVELPCTETFEKGVSYEMTVVIAPDSESPEEYTCQVEPRP